MHGGTVAVESHGPGLGSVFSVRLPLAGSRAGAGIRSSRPTSQTAGTGWRVLVVDDNEDSASSMARVLTLLNNVVRTANDGVEAVQAADEFRPDIILMDLGMLLNGYEATSPDSRIAVGPVRHDHRAHRLGARRG